MRNNLGYITETILGYYNNDNDYQNIDEQNIIDSNNVNDNFEYNVSSQQNNDEEFDYTLLKIIVFLIFV